MDRKNIKEGKLLENGEVLETRSSDSKLSDENDDIIMRKKRNREIMSEIATGKMQFPIKKIKIETYDIYYKNKVRKTYLNNKESYFQPQTIEDTELHSQESLINKKNQDLGLTQQNIPSSTPFLIENITKPQNLFEKSSDNPIYHIETPKFGVFSEKNSILGQFSEKNSILGQFSNTNTTQKLNLFQETSTNDSALKSPFFSTTSSSFFTNTNNSPAPKSQINSFFVQNPSNIENMFEEEGFAPDSGEDNDIED